jgi:dUTP pyrophosphatase
MQVKKLHKDAVVPVRAHATDAGLDLYSIEDAVIYPGQTEKVKTGIALAIPEGKVGLIWPRSSLGVKGLDVMAGVVDASYRGEVVVCLYNGNPNVVPYDHGVGPVTMSDTTYDNVLHLPKGSKVAQILIQDVCLCQPVEVDELDETVRGQGGFGSTGK